MISTFAGLMKGKRLCSVPFSHMLLNCATKLQGRIPPADGTPRTLSRIYRAFINVPMAEAHDFHCHPHVTDTLGERSMPSDHVAIRVVIRKPLDQCGTGKRIPNWKQISDLSSVPRRAFLPLLLTASGSLRKQGNGLDMSFFATHRAVWVPHS